MAALLMMAISACSVEKEQPLETEDGSQSFTITANIPSPIWGEVTRSYTDEAGTFKLHYVDYKGEKVVYTIPAEYIDVYSTEIRVNYNDFNKDKNLVWERIMKNAGQAEFHLTSMFDSGSHLHASAVVTHGAENISFALKRSMAQLTLELLVNDKDNNFTENVFYATISGKETSDSYDPWTNGEVWPTSETSLEPIALKGSAALGGYYFEKLLPEQTLGDILTLTYGSYEWYLDLSKVTVTGGKEGQMANQVYAGQNLTLSLQAYINELNAPSIEVTAFVEENKELDGAAEAGYVYDEATKTYTVHNEHGLYVWLNAYLEDREVKLDTYDYFDLSEVDLELPNSFLYNGMKAFAVDDDGNLTLAGRQWKSISIMDKDGTNVLGTMVATNGYPTLAIGEIGENGENCYYVIDGNYEISSSAEENKATFYIIRELVRSLVEAKVLYLYVLNELVLLPDALSEAMWDDAINSRTMLGGAIWHAYYVDNEYSTLAQMKDIILADATKIPPSCFSTISCGGELNAPKVTTIGAEAFFNANFSKFIFGSVITDIGDDAFFWYGNYNLNYWLVLNENQKNSADNLKPEIIETTDPETGEVTSTTYQWWNHTWANISFQ